MLNFVVNGTPVGVVFATFDPVVIPHPRKGFERSEMILAYVFVEQGLMGTGWAIRSPKDSQNDATGMKVALGKGLLNAFPDQRDATGKIVGDNSKVRESIWKQYFKAVKKQDAVDADERAIAEKAAQQATDMMDRLLGRITVQPTEPGEPAFTYTGSGEVDAVLNRENRESIAPSELTDMIMNGAVLSPDPEYRAPVTDDDIPF
jgi:hypothetical protein